MKIDDINNMFKNGDLATVSQLINEFKNDTRVSITKLVNKYAKEIKRIEEITYFEKKYSLEGKKYICGIDEVGRGCLAGPVCSVSVIMPMEKKLLWVNDSKKLSEKKRQKLFEEIQDKALSIGIGLVSNEEIDKTNILQATKKSMEISISNLNIIPDQILLDAVKLDNINIPSISIIKGDEKSYSIACASIIAKVTRDEIMKMYDEIYKGYNFEKNKGYGTKEHIQCIKNIGISNIHRKTFLKNMVI